MKKILLQCQSITYYYMGLAAIYTKYPNRDVEICVILTNRNSLNTPFYDILKKSKYTDKIYIIDKNKISKINKKICKLKNDFWGNFQFNIHKKSITRNLDKILKEEDFTDIFYSHDTCNLMTHLKIKYPNLNLAIYGDGPGSVTNNIDEMIKPEYCTIKDNSTNLLFKQTFPNEIRALIPYIEDGTDDFDNLPVYVTDKNILIDLIRQDDAIQYEIKEFAKYLKENFSDKNICCLLTSKLNDTLTQISKEESNGIYINLIEKYCPKGSVVLIKQHPMTDENVAPYIADKLNGDYKIIEIPTKLNLLPIEIWTDIIENIDRIITFISSSIIVLKHLYTGKNIISGFESVKNKNLIDRFNTSLEVAKNLVKKLETWDGKSIIYKTNVIPKILEYYKKYDIEYNIEHKYIECYKKYLKYKKLFNITLGLFIFFIFISISYIYLILN